MLLLLLAPYRPRIDLTVASWIPRRFPMAVALSSKAKFQGVKIKHQLAVGQSGSSQN